VSKGLFNWTFTRFLAYLGVGRFSIDGEQRAFSIIGSEAMTARHRLLSISIASLGWAAITLSYAASANVWDGIWSGMLDDSVSVSIGIADDKAVSYEIKGTPIGIKFSKMSNNSLEFGDPRHYNIQLKRTGEATATASYYGRHGYSVINLTRTQH
jgi:hypothetical protein